jgi:RNA polymerase sigma factor (sigma-70 family)
VHFFLRRTRDPETAFDLVAETFARALEHARRFRGGADADPWVWGIARNVLAEHVRRDRVEQRAFRRLALERTVTTAEPMEPADDRAPREPGPATHALQALVVDQRDALRLRVVEELDYAVVAQRLISSSSPPAGAPAAWPAASTCRTRPQTCRAEDGTTHNYFSRARVSILC